MREITTVHSRYEAFMVLGLTMDSSDEMIKKQYKLLCKKFHPDQNKEAYAQKYYIRIQEAYQYLKDHPFTIESEIHNTRIINNSMQQVNPYGYTMYNNGYQNMGQNYIRPVKIFSTNKNAEKLHKRQIAYTEDKKRIENSLKAKNTEVNENSLNKEDEKVDPLKAIQTIWLAEQIHRQIEMDRIQKQREHKQNLYKAFSEHNKYEDQ